MCGINGFTWTDEALAERMNEVTRHRGPDAERTKALSGITLGFNRLAIIDLSERSMQPMMDASGRFTLVFNGEIYNYRDLKKELSSYNFVTEGDGEVILAAYTKWGKDAFSRLNGMFALAIWDKETEELILARDASGIKPLYYAEREGKLMFSSELPALFEAGIPRVLNREALGHYLRLKYVPAPQTMVQGVQKLMSGAVLSWKDGRSEISHITYQTSHTPRISTYTEAVKEVRQSVEEAVVRQLVSDVPVGLYLSGGIDSSVILASASRVHPSINTFSVGFDLSDEEEREKFNRDAVLAKQTAKHFGATHHEFFLSSEGVLALLPEAVQRMSEPVGNPTTLAQLYLAKKTKAIATVILTGEGGDELFGGYERYRLALRAGMLARVTPAFIDQFLSGSFKTLHKKGVGRFAQLMFEKEETLSRILPVGFALPDTALFFANHFSGGDIADELMRADENGWLVGEALLRADNMSMAAALEARVPFLDEEVKALAHALPRAYKVDLFRTKKILKDAFADTLPPELLTQPKRGWFSPGAKWLRRPDFIRYVDELFSDSGVPTGKELFHMEGVRALLTEHRGHTKYHATVLWTLIIFFSWMKEHRITV